MYFAKEEVVELNPPNEWRKVQINRLKKHDAINKKP